jgi:hypothetical protein
MPTGPSEEQQYSDIVVFLLISGAHASRFPLFKYATSETAWPGTLIVSRMPACEITVR